MPLFKSIEPRRARHQESPKPRPPVTFRPILCAVPLSATEQEEAEAILARLIALAFYEDKVHFANVVVRRNLEML